MYYKRLEETVQRGVVYHKRLEETVQRGVVNPVIVSVCLCMVTSQHHTAYTHPLSIF